MERGGSARVTWASLVSTVRIVGQVQFWRTAFCAADKECQNASLKLLLQEGKMLTFPQFAFCRTFL